MILSREEQARIGKAIRAAEATTGAELVCAVTARASSYSTFPLIWAILPTLVLPWLLLLTTGWPVSRLLLAQLVLFAALLVVLSVPAIRLALVPRRIRRREAHRVAMEQFVIRGLAHKPERTGVLVFVALAERYVRIVADEGVATKVPQHAFDEAVAAMTTAFAAGRLADGMVEGVARCGALLAEAVPPQPEHRNVLPDRVFLV